MNRPLVFGGVAVIVAAAAVGFLVVDQSEPLEQRAAESAVVATPEATAPEVAIEAPVASLPEAEPAEEAVAAVTPEEVTEEAAETPVVIVPEVVEEATEEAVAAVDDVIEEVTDEVAAAEEVVEETLAAVPEAAEVVPEAIEEAVVKEAAEEAVAVAPVPEVVEEETPARRVVDTVGDAVEKAADAVAETARDLAETARESLDDLAGDAEPDVAQVEEAPDVGQGLVISPPEEPAAVAALPDLTQTPNEIDAVPAAGADETEVEVPQVAALPTPEESSVAPEAPVEAVEVPEAVAPRVVARQPEDVPEAPVGGDVPATPPTFDVVRVDRTGGVVIAGRSAPLCKIEVQDGDAVVGMSEANTRGEWVVVPEQPLAPGSRELGLRATCGGAEALSDRLVVVVVPEQGENIAGQASDADAGALALSVPRSGDGATQVLQAPEAPRDDDATAVASTDETDAVGLGLTALSLDVVDYNAEGDLQVSGQAEAGSTLRVYLDNGLVGEATADDTAKWTLQPDESVEPGLYTLRVDQVAPNGIVTARVELPFLRGEPLRDLPEGRIVVVQPGNSLWRIARRTYGSGLQFTQIFEANADQIRNPDLIYPGQIFTLPTVN